MDYLEWNRLIGEHFFPSNESDRTSNYLCVTGQLLAELGGFPDSNSAIQDFVESIRKGPPWTQIDRCSTILSKAHNCLNPDPKWEKRKTFFGKKTEKINLTGNIHWKEFRGYADYHPPYLAYLCLFILAYTERHDEDFALNYNKPLTRLLGTDEHLPLYKRYVCNGSENTINTIWQDLEEWVREKGITGFRLPPEKNEDYIYIPLYFGLLKARDLRALDGLFTVLEKKGLLDPANVPSAERLVQNLHKLSDISKYLSREGVQAVNDNDVTKRRALGSLLYAKYLEWDGPSEETETGSVPCYFRAVMLLRYLSTGTLQSVVKIRSQSLLEKLPIEAGREYALKNEKTKIIWPGGTSLWFEPINLMPSDPFSGITVECEELPIKPKMMSLEYLVMENYELPFHLQGQNGYIEVEGRKGLEPGRRYLLLTASREKPQIENLDIRQNHGMLVPDGTTAWWINVPLMPDRETWPDVLPPLAELPRPIKPIIKLESFVRVEPRSSMFLSGYPLKISSSQSNYEPFIKSQNGDRSIELEPIDGEWVLTTKCPSEVVVSLRCTSDMKEVEGSSKKVLFIDSETTKIEEVLPRLATAKYFEHTPQIPPYPSATVSLEGGIHMGMRDNKYPVYLVNDRPSVTIKSPLNSGVRLFIDGNERANGEKPWSTRGKHEAQARYKNGAVLDTVTFELLDAVDDNIISIEGLSDKKNSPTKFLQTYVIYIKASLPLPVQIYYQIKDKEYKRKYSLTLKQEAQITLSEKTPLRRWHIYEIEFFLEKRQIYCGWAQWSPNHNSSFHNMKVRKPRGLLNIGSIFEGIRRNKSKE
jgi:hypothetical protein